MDVGAKQYAYIKLSELSDDPSAKPEDIVKVGDEVETYVVRVNDVEGYAELSKKRLDAVKIWENIETAVEEKTVLEGTVTEENKGGIVVSVKGIRVFVPASQSGQPRGADLSAMKGQKVQLRITEVNRARRRVVGSIRSVTDEARKAAQEAVWSTIAVSYTPLDVYKRQALFHCTGHGEAGPGRAGKRDPDADRLHPVCHHRRTDHDEPQQAVALCRWLSGSENGIYEGGGPDAGELCGEKRPAAHRRDLAGRQ